jgi:TolB-like protein/Flp pilus assembly protein TadD
MSRLRSLIQEIHRRSLWQVLGIYIVGGWIALQVVDTLGSAMALPEWFPGVALALLIVGLPTVLATAFIHEGGPRDSPEATAPAAPAVERPLAETMLTWPTAIAGGVLAFTLLGLVTTAWVVLGQGGSGSPELGTDPRSVAVLPFQNLSAEEENASFFAAGMHDDLLTQLSKISGLAVIARTSVVQYRDTEKPIPQIGEELGVAAVVEGGVQRAGNRVRINAQLIDAKTGTHIWAETYERELTTENIFAIQGEIAGQIASALAMELSPEERAQIESRPTENLEAYDAYLRAEEFWSSGEEVAAIGLLEQATELDPGFAQAFARESWYRTQRYYLGRERSEANLTSARAAAERAMELDSTLSASRRALGFYYHHGAAEYDRALQILRPALEADQNNSGLMWEVASIERRQGRFEEAVRLLERALRVDPRNTSVLADLTWSYIHAHRWGDAGATGARWRELRPGSQMATLLPAWVQLLKAGDTLAAWAIVDGLRQQAPGRVLSTDSHPHSVVTRLLRAEDLSTALEARVDVLETALGEGGNVAAQYFVRTAQLARLRGSEAEEHEALLQAADELERIVRLGSANEGWTRMDLALVNVELGRRDEALEEATRAVGLFQADEEAFYERPRAMIVLARVHAAFGEAGPAIEILEQQLSPPSWLSPAVLRIDPTWDPIRDDPRFQALVN